MTEITLNESEKEELKNCLLTFVRRVTSIKRGNMESVLGEEILILPEIVKLLLCLEQISAFEKTLTFSNAKKASLQEFLQRNNIGNVLRQKINMKKEGLS